MPRKKEVKKAKLTKEVKKSTAKKLDKKKLATYKSLLIKLRDDILGDIKNLKSFFGS